MVRRPFSFSPSRGYTAATGAVTATHAHAISPAPQLNRRPSTHGVQMGLATFLATHGPSRGKFSQVQRNVQQRNELGLP